MCLGAGSLLGEESTDYPPGPHRSFLRWAPRTKKALTECTHRAVRSRDRGKIDRRGSQKGEAKVTEKGRGRIRDFTGWFGIKKDGRHLSQRGWLIISSLCSIVAAPKAVCLKRDLGYYHGSPFYRCII